MSHRKEDMTPTEAIADAFVSDIVRKVLPQVPEIVYWEIPADDQTYAAASFRFAFRDDCDLGKFEFEARRYHFGKKLEDLEAKLREHGLPSLFDQEIWDAGDETADEGCYGIYPTREGISKLASMAATAQSPDVAEFVRNAKTMAEEVIAYSNDYLWDYRKHMDQAEEDEPGSSDRSEWQAKIARAEELIVKAEALLNNGEK